MTVSPVGHSSGPLALSTIMGDYEDAIEEEEDDLFGPERRRGYRSRAHFTERALREPRAHAEACGAAGGYPPSRSA